MTDITYADRKGPYLKTKGLEGDPQESDLLLAGLEYDGPVAGLDFSGTHKNRMTRLLAQDYFVPGMPGQEVPAAAMMSEAQDLFANLFNDPPGEHPYLDALRAGGTFRPVWKSRVLHGDLYQTVTDGWEGRDSVSTETQGPLREAVEEVLNLLDNGTLRVASKYGKEWETDQWLKQAVLLSFRLDPNELMGIDPFRGTEGQHAPGPWWDKVPLKCAGWGSDDFIAAGFRAVPGSIVRRGAFIGKNAVLMPSFVNIGAYVDEGTMVDGWATVGSCAQVGKNCHISGGAGIGGVLEPLQANPTIIEDGCFIGARAEVAEGVIVGEGSVLSMGVYLTSTTKIIDRKTGEVHRGYVPPYSVVVSGSVSDPTGRPGPHLYCAVIVKTVDAQTREKTIANELLRD